jgi:hypothetical protein
VTNQPSSSGVSERLSARSRADEHVERLALAGVTVIESHLTPQEVAALVPRVDRLLQRQAEEAGGIERLAEIFHRAGTNASAAPRRAVNHVFMRSFIAQQVSFPSMLDGRYSDDPELARLLGYGIGAVPSVSDWCERRRRRAR